MTTRACLAAMVLVCGAMAQDPQKEHKEAMAVLGLFEGNWRKEFKLLRGFLNPADAAKTGTHECRQALGGALLQETGRDSDGSTYMSIYTFDPSDRAFKLSVFQSNGVVSHMRGDWNPQTRSFTWINKRDDGAVTTATYSFDSPHEYRFSIVTRKDGAFELARIEGKGTKSGGNRK